MIMATYRLNDLVSWKFWYDWKIWRREGEKSGGERETCRRKEGNVQEERGRKKREERGKLFQNIQSF